MPDLIRKIKDSNDLHGIYNLYEGEKSLDELKWLLTDPYNRDSYNGFVAVNHEGLIVGLIGFVPTVYSINNKRQLGISLMSWKLSPGANGMSGIMLLKKASHVGDFAYVAGGTSIAQRLYSLMGFKMESSLLHFEIILNLIDYFESLKLSSLRRLFGMTAILLPNHLLNSFKRYDCQNVNFEPYDRFKVLKEEGWLNYFGKNIAKPYVDWLLDCPDLNSYAFSIQIAGRLFGVCILSIKNRNGKKVGRIVHLPYLGSDKNLLKQVINKCIIFFEKNGCCSVSALSHQDLMNEAFRNTGFKNIKKLNKPLYLRDKTSILSKMDLSNWYLQYSEGDLFHRDF